MTDRALGSLYQNTIDYHYRDPLVHFVPRTRNLTAPSPHHFGYSPDNMWSVVAIRPQAGTDYDLRVYEDRALTTSIGRSALGGSVIDFVAVDHTEGRTGPVFPHRPRSRSPHTTSPGSASRRSRPAKRWVVR